MKAKWLTRTAVMVGVLAIAALAVAAPALAHEGPPDGRRPPASHPFFRARAVLHEVTEQTEMTHCEVIRDLAAGDTLAEIAEEEGVEPEAITDGLLAHLDERLSRLVENERITQARADEIRANAAERLGSVMGEDYSERAQQIFDRVCAMDDDA